MHARSVHADDVSVRCDPPAPPEAEQFTVRLVDGGAPNRGRVEIYYNNQVGWWLVVGGTMMVALCRGAEVMIVSCAGPKGC